MRLQSHPQYKDHVCEIEPESPVTPMKLLEFEVQFEHEYDVL